MRDRMHSRVAAVLNDGCAQYQSPDGLLVVPLTEVMIDRNLMQNGPDGMFRSDATGVTWRKQLLGNAARGGVITFGAERWIVEEIVADDGHFVTAACMEEQ